MKTKDKKKLKLKQVLNYLNSIPNINYGGCGISALAVYRWVKKYYEFSNVQILFCYYGDNKYDYNNNVRVFKTCKGYLTSPQHVVLKYKNIMFDSKGVYRHLNADFPLEHEATRLDLFISVLNDLSEWNNMFERKTNVIKNIENKLEIDLSDVKCW